MTQDRVPTVPKRSFFKQSLFGVIAVLIALLAGVANVSRILVTGQTSLHLEEFIGGNSIIWIAYSILIICSPLMFGFVALVLDKKKWLAILSLVLSFINWVGFGVISLGLCATLAYCGGG